MSFLRGTEEYYQKFIELQEKLRKSEEERLILEMKFNEMVQVSREEEQAYYRKLRNQYKRFLEEDHRRQERNERIMRILERIESRASMLAAKTERFELLRQQYHAYLKRVFSNTKYGQDPVYQPPLLSEEIPTIAEEKTDLYNNPIIQKAMYDSKYDNVGESSDLYEHPVIKKALSVSNEAGKLSPKLDVVKQYLRSLSPPISGEEVLKASRSSGKISSIRNTELTESNDSSYNDDYPYYKTKAGHIADKIITSINSKPKISTPRRDDDSKTAFRDGKDKHRPPISPIEIRIDNVRSEAENSVGELSKNIKYLGMQEPETFPSKSIEKIKEGEVKFENIYDEKDDRMPEIPIMSEHIKDYPVNDAETIIEEHKNVKDDFGKETLDSADFALQENMENKLLRPNESEDDCLLDVENAELSNDDEVKQKFIREEDAEALNLQTEKAGGDCTNLVKDKTIEEQDSEYIRDEEHRKEQVGNVVQEDFGESEREEFDVNGQAAVVHDENGKPIKQFDSDGVDIENGDLHDIQQYNQEKGSIEQIDSKIVQEQVIKPMTENTDSKSGAEHGSESATLHQEDKDTNQRQDNDNSDDRIEYDQNQLQYENEQVALQYDQAKQSALEYGVNGQPVHYGDNDQGEYVDSVQNNPQYENEENALQYDQNNEPVLRYDDNVQPVHYVDGDQHSMPYDGSDPTIMQYNQSGHYDEHGQPIIQYDDNGQPLTQYNETIMQYDENGQPLYGHYEENQPHMQYDENGQPIVQYHESGQPIVQYDENGQPIMQYDENGQPLYTHYDENNQPHMQYDENGQPIVQYDENGQPIVQYDENGQPIVQYDENGQPIYQYDQNEGYYTEGGQIYSGEKENYEQPISIVENVMATKELEGSNEERKVDVPKDELAKNSPAKEKKGNVMEMLDTDTDSVRQDTNKVSNDSDFDFSNN